jgi:hypothetical protein
MSWNNLPWGYDWGGYGKDAIGWKHRRKVSLAYQNLIKQAGVPIRFYLGLKAKDSSFDPQESNYYRTDRNPTIARGLVRLIENHSSVAKHYGITTKGSVEILLDQRYLSLIKNASKIEINGTEYEVYSNTTGNISPISQTGFGYFSVILQKNKECSWAVENELGLKKHQDGLSLELQKLIKQYGLPVRFIFGTKTKDSSYDEIEYNYTKELKNPNIAKALVRPLDVESLVFRKYGLSMLGSVEIILDKRYLEWVKTCSKVEINGNEYEVYADTVGQYASFHESSYGYITTVLQKVKGTNQIVPSGASKLSLESKKFLKQYGTTILVYPGFKSKDEAFDSYEDSYKVNTVNPIAIRAYVFDSTSLIKLLSHYGLKENMSKEIITTKENTNLLLNSYKIEIDRIDYHAFKDGVGGKAVLLNDNDGMVKIIVESI